MSHMVIYRTGDGQPGYHQTKELDEAVKYVETLRNSDGIDGARIFRMDEVNFDFRPYFKVEIGPSAVPRAGAEPATAPVPEPPTAPAEVPGPAGGAPAPEVPSPPGDAWGDLTNEPLGEPTPLVEQAAAFMADPDPEPEAAPEENGEKADESVGARRGLFGR